MDLSSSTSTTLVAAAGAATLTIATLALAFRSSSSSSSSKTSKMPPQYKTGLPLIGPFLHFAHDPLGAVEDGRKALGDVFSIRLLNERVNFLVGPEPHAAFFNATDDELDQADVYKFMKPIFGPNIVYDAPIELRRQQMRCLAGALKPSNLRLYPPVIADETMRYFKSHWAKLPGGSGTADIHHTFADLIIQTGSATLMGPEVRNELFDEMFRLYQDLDKGLTPLSVFFPYAPTPAHARRDKARKDIGDLFARIINKRRQDPEAYSNTDIVQRLMEFSYTDGRKLSEDEIAGMMVATLFAAQHTSNVTATWTLLFLLEDKRKGGNLLQRVLAEMRSLEPEPGAFAAGRGVDYNVISKQTFLYACVKEAIRMHPPIIFLMRRAMVDLPVCGGKYVIPKGDMVMVSNAVAQRLSEVFERPNEYLPDRWATWDISKLPKYSFIGFSAGLHTCLGESFAFLQVRSILNVLLSTYDMDLISPFPEPDYEAIVVMPKGPNVVSFKPRDASAIAPLPTSFDTVKESKVKLTGFTEDADARTKYTRAEIAKHNTKESCWIIVSNKVYDVTQYLHLHQGGENAILNVAGGEATAKVDGPQHPSTVRALLESRYCIGVVADV